MEDLNHVWSGSAFGFVAAVVVFKSENFDQVFGIFLGFGVIGKVNEFIVPLMIAGQGKEITEGEIDFLLMGGETDSSTTENKGGGGSYRSWWDGLS